MAPAVIRATDGPENLQHLDPLLPQPTIVEDGRGVPETRIREKSLHRRRRLVELEHHVVEVAVEPVLTWLE